MIWSYGCDAHEVSIPRRSHTKGFKLTPFDHETVSYVYSHTFSWKFCFVRRASLSRSGVYVPCIVFEHRASLFGAPFRTLCTHPYVQATRPSSLML